MLTWTFHAILVVLACSDILAATMVSQATKSRNAHKSGVSIVMTMICRDEEVNLRSNLPLWLSMIDYFVFLIDSRNTDNSIAAIESILKNKAGYKIVTNEFDGFGQSRTRSLETAWQEFPQATHVWIADPDWKPDVKTMNKEDINHNTDVFGFLSYDRTGYTTRQMHWLLKNRKGLRMRYNLHEVLDIGPYNWTNTDWVIHEIEQTGSWHTTVGHGNSMSKKRYEFDLSMLLKDLKEYGHDPHTHYYLGITYEAFASALMMEANAMTEEVVHNFNQSVFFLTKRVFEAYQSEFLEERWACMMTLGTVHSKFYGAMQTTLNWGVMVEAEKWFTMCSRYDSTYVECPLNLIKLYMVHNHFDKAMTTAMDLITTPKSPRNFINHYKLWDCDIPLELIRLFLIKLRMRPDQSSGGDAKYVLLLKAHVEQNKKICSGTTYLLTPDDQTLMKQFLGNNQVILQRNSIEMLCGDNELQGYLATARIKLHPCDALKKTIDITHYCRFFQVDIPTINEEIHVRNFKTYLGALSMNDLSHHIHGGDFGTLFNGNSSIRILFAEFFNEKMLFNLAGFSLRNPSLKIDVVVVSPAEDFESRITSSISSCEITLPRTLKLTYQTSTFEAYLQQWRGMKLPPFNYIEFSFSARKNASLEADLSRLREALHDKNGVLGLTFFSKNTHQRRLFELLENRDESVHIPFSNHVEHLISSYLDIHRMEFLKEDADFMDFFGGTMGAANYREVIGGKDWTLSLGTPFSQPEIKAMASSLGLTIKSWFPTAYAHPYDEIPQYEIQKFRSSGMKQTDFVGEIMPSFRYSVYIMKNTSEVDGRPRLDEFITNKSLDSSTFIFDRLGNLGGAFSNIVERAKAKMPTQMAFSWYTLDGRFKMEYSILPQYSSFLSLLSSSPSIADMISINKRNYMQSAGPSDKYDDYVARQQVVLALQLLESINYITLYKVATKSVSQQEILEDGSSKGSFGNKPDNTIANGRRDGSAGADKGLKQSTAATNERIAKMRKMGFPDSVIQAALAKDGVSGSPDTVASKSAQSSSFSSPSTGSSTSSGASTSSASQNTKIEKMRKMGFPDSVIQAAIARDQVEQSKSSSNEPPNATKSSTPTAQKSTPENEKSSERDASIIPSNAENSKAEKMRKMGFPESVIQAALAKDRLSQDAGKTASLPSKQEPAPNSPPPTQTSKKAKDASKGPELVGATSKRSAPSQAAGLIPQNSMEESKIAKMKKMGFPESTIQSIIEKERAKG